MLSNPTPLVIWSTLCLAIAAWIVTAFFASGRAFGFETLRGMNPKRMAVAAALVAVAAMTLFVRQVAPPRFTGDDLGLASVITIPDATMVTDQGRPIEMRRFSRAAAPDDVPQGYEGRLILVGVAEALSNCHGWVFTGGRFCLSAADVVAILRDNAYTRIEHPRPQDLIIYRDEQGLPVHTGIVKAVGEGGFVLVESKWGQLQVFWHLPDDQRYSDRYDYWRSDRSGHLLRMPRS